MHTQLRLLLNVQQAADHIGTSDKWIRRRICEGTLPFPWFKIGKHLRFDQADLDRYLDSCRREAVAV